MKSGNENYGESGSSSNVNSCRILERRKTNTIVEALPSSAKRTGLLFSDAPKFFGIPPAVIKRNGMQDAISAEMKRRLRLTRTKKNVGTTFSRSANWSKSSKIVGSSLGEQR